MKFLAALSGKQKRQTRELREMEGQLHSFPDVEVIVLADVADDDRHPLPEKKKQLYCEAFANTGNNCLLVFTRFKCPSDISVLSFNYLYELGTARILQ